MRDLTHARASGFTTDWDNHPIPVPWFLGRRRLKPSADEIAPLIGGDNAVRVRALEWLKDPHGPVPIAVYGFWPANSSGDDIVVYRDDARASRLVEIQTLRQQCSEPGQPSFSLADFVAPRESFAPDYLCAVAVTLGPDRESSAAAPGRDTRLMEPPVVRALQEAVLSYVRGQVRDDWGLDSVASLPGGAATRAPQIIEVGSPAGCLPDVAVREALVRLLHLGELGIDLDAGYALAPGDVSVGICVAHSGFQAFDVGPVDADQLADYAGRRGEPLSAVAARLFNLVRPCGGA